MAQSGPLAEIPSDSASTLSGPDFGTGGRASSNLEHLVEFTGQLISSNTLTALGNWAAEFHVWVTEPGLMLSIEEVYDVLLLMASFQTKRDALLRDLDDRLRTYAASKARK